MALLKLCRCGKTITMQQGTCERCQAMQGEKKRQRHKEYKDKRKGNDNRKFYSSKAWKVTRERIKRRDNGLCQLCWDKSRIKPMHTVHHIIELDDSDRLALVHNNLISLCEPCHQHVHKEYKEPNKKFEMQKKLKVLLG